MDDAVDGAGMRRRGRRRHGGAWVVRALPAAMLSGLTLVGCTTGTKGPDSSAAGGSAATDSVAGSGAASTVEGSPRSPSGRGVRAAVRWRETVLVDPDAAPSAARVLRAARPLDLPFRPGYSRLLLALDSDGDALVAEGHQATQDYDTPHSYAAGIGLMPAFGGRIRWAVPVPARRREVGEGVAVGDVQGSHAVWALASLTTVRVMTAPTNGTGRPHEIGRDAGSGILWPTLVVAGEQVFWLRARVAGPDTDRILGTLARLPLSGTGAVVTTGEVSVVSRDECAPADRPRIAFVRQPGTRSAPGPVQVWVWDADQPTPQLWWDAGALPLPALVSGVAVCGEGILLSAVLPRDSDTEDARPPDGVLVRTSRGDGEVPYQLLPARVLGDPQWTPQMAVLTESRPGGGNVVLLPSGERPSRLPHGDGCAPAILRGDVLVWWAAQCTPMVARLAG